MKPSKFTEQEIASAKSVLITQPYFGSLWLDVIKVKDGYVEGETWDNTNAGDSSYPDGYRGEMICMNFPISCVRKIF